MTKTKENKIEKMRLSGFPPYPCVLLLLSSLGPGLPSDSMKEKNKKRLQGTFRLPVCMLPSSAAGPASSPCDLCSSTGPYKQKGPHARLMLCCRPFEILNSFLKGSLVFLSSPGPRELCSLSCRETCFRSGNRQTQSIPEPPDRENCQAFCLPFCPAPDCCAEG